jgi:hypothetical protein
VYFDQRSGSGTKYSITVPSTTDTKQAISEAVGSKQGTVNITQCADRTGCPNWVVRNFAERTSSDPPVTCWSHP